MNKVAFLTDLGSASFELMDLKMAAISGAQHVQVIDLYNDISNFDINEAFFFLKAVWNKIDSSTAIIVCVGESTDKENNWMASVFENKLVIAPNNGILPMLLEGTGAAYFTFSNEMNLAQVIQLVLGNPDWVKQCKNLVYPVKYIPQQASFDGKYIRGTIVHIDKFGNLYSNVSKAFILQYFAMDEILIRVRREEQIAKISKKFNDVGQGDVLALFDNNDEHLIIAVHFGNANRLLGLGLGKNIFIGKIQ